MHSSFELLCMSKRFWVFFALFNHSGSMRDFAQEISRSAVLAFAMASFAAVMCSTLLSAPFWPSSVYGRVSIAR